MTFVHRFSRSLSCTMTVSDDPPSNGENFVQQVEWTERPKTKHLANHWNLRLMQAVQTDPRLWEFWGYEPGQAPKLMKKSTV
jgi:hypothetical protein